MTVLNRWTPLPFVAVGLVATSVLTVLHLIVVYAVAAQSQDREGIGRDPAGTAAFFALYLVPSALVEGVLVGLAAFAVAWLLGHVRRVPRRWIPPLSGLAAMVAALGLIVIPLVGFATGGLVQVGAGIVVLVTGAPGSGSANLIAALALALLLYVGAFTVGAPLLSRNDAVTTTDAR
ncbi:energy-coupling factor transporter transmembrane protein EcfT [Rathayibacter agropyri]